MPVYADFDQATLDREYSPSSRVDDIDIFLKQYRDDSERARSAAAVGCIENLRYGPGGEQTLDLFLPDAAAAVPLQVFVHGGYWQALGKDDSCFAAPGFLAHGAAFAAINYTLAPHETLTGIVGEVCRAIGWLYFRAADYGYDPDRIFLSGHSAGAHLAAMMLAADWTVAGMPADLVKGVAAVSGVYDLEPVRLSYVNDVVRMDAREAAANSPQILPLRNRCPVIVAIGDNETAEFKRQTTEYRDKLVREGVAVDHAEIPSRNHFDVITDLGDDTTWLGQQVLRQMGLPGI